MTYEALKPFLAAFVRWALTALASMLAAHGLMSSSGTEQFIGFGTTLAGLAWSWWEKSGRAAVAADIANLRAILAARAAAARAGASTPPLPPLQVGGTVAVPPQAVTAAKVGAILLAIMVLAHGEVRAQATTKKIGGPIGQVLDKIDESHGGASTPVDRAIGGNSQIAKLLAKPFTDLANFINSDALAAAKLAIAIPELQDGHGQQCWLAMGQFTAVLKAHPIPLTLNAMDDLQALRLAAMAANNVCRNASCTQVFSDLANGIQKVAPINLGIPIPSLNSLCSQVPVVTVVPTVPMPPEPPPAPAAAPAQQP